MIKSEDFKMSDTFGFCPHHLLTLCDLWSDTLQSRGDKTSPMGLSEIKLASVCVICLV